MRNCLANQHENRTETRAKVADSGTKTKTAADGYRDLRISLNKMIIRSKSPVNNKMGIRKWGWVSFRLPDLSGLAATGRKKTVYADPEFSIKC